MASVGITLGVLVAFLAILTSSLSVFGLPVFTGSKHGIGLGIAVALGSFILGRLNPSGLRPKPFAFAFAVLFLILSDWIHRPYSILPGHLIRGELLIVFLFALLVRPTTKIVLFLAPCIAFALLTDLLLMSNGRALSGDDHGTFLYRLLALREQFPSIPFYLPLWNAGLDARDFFATGALAPFLLFFPIIALTSVPDSYTLLVALILFVLMPLSIFTAGRCFSLPSTSSAVASICALGASFLWYRWGLSYGTLGFLTAMALFPSALGQLHQLFTGQLRSSPVRIALLVATVSLVMLWPPASFLFIPITLLFIRAWSKKEVLLVGAILALVHLPWMALFVEVSNVATFVEHSAPSIGKPGSGAPWSELLLTLARDKLVSTNPLLLMAIPGVLLVPPGVALTLLWMVGLAVFGVLYRPQLELDRFIIVAMILSTIPAARAVEELLTSSRSVAERGLGVFCVSLAIVGALSVGLIVRNRSIERIWFQDDRVTSLVNKVNSLSPTGRIFFSGFVLHEFAGGHVAPLPFLAPAEYLASSPVHDSWIYRHSVPSEFMPDRVSEYLTAMNVEYIFAHEPRWRSYFRKYPDLYLPRGETAPFEVFEFRAAPRSAVHLGSADVRREGIDTLSVSVHSESVVLRYRYFPFLQAPGCTVAPWKLSESVTFIELKNCSGVTTQLRSVGPLGRFLQELSS